MTTAIATAVTIQVGTQRLPWEEFTMSWLTDQLRRQASRCVRIEVDHPDANLLLRSGGCPPASARSTRPPNRKEQAIFDLWDYRGMHDAAWAPGNLNAFLQQLRGLL